MAPRERGKPVKWANVKIPELLAADIDAYLTSDDAKRNGIFSRADYVIRVIAADIHQKKADNIGLVSGKSKY